MRKDELFSLARTIDPARAPALESRFRAWGDELAGAAALATVVVAAFPAFAQLAEARPSMFADLWREGWRAPRTRQGLLATLQAKAGDLSDGENARSGLRLGVQYEKLRIATRELLPRALNGADVDTTSAEIALLAEASIEVALAEAMHHASERWGPPMTASGDPSTFVVLGMGKLGGGELNAGSDIDVLYFYDTDEGMVVPKDGGDAITLHHHWSQIARRLTANLDATTPEGMVWRVDLRLRPEGSQGPILRNFRPSLGARSSSARPPRGRRSRARSRGARRAPAFRLRAPRRSTHRARARQAERAGTRGTFDESSA